MPTKVTLKKISNNGPKQKAIAEQACALLEQAINHPNFKEMVESAKYRQTRFRDGEGRAFSVPVNEILNYITSGIERGTAEDQEIDIEVALMKLDGNPVGSTIPGKLPFFTSYWFINECLRKESGPANLARHFIHEWLHVSGFYHHPDNSARKDVPYNVGDIVVNLLLGDAKAKSEEDDPNSLAYALDHVDCGTGDPDLLEDIESGNREDLQM